MAAEMPHRLSRRGFLRNAGALAAMAAGGSVLNACGSSGGAASIRFYANKRETIPYFTKIADDFNASQSSYRAEIENSTNLVADFVRNTPVAIGMTTFNLAFGGFIQRGVLADQTDNPLIATVRRDVIDYSKQFGTYNGEVSAVPYSMAAGGVIYNRELFDQEAASIPTTWTEFIATCELLKSRGITPIVGTFLDSWSIQQGMFDFMVGGMLPSVGDFFAQLNAQGTDVGPDSPVSFSKDFVAPMEKMRELLPYFNSDARNIAYDQGNRDFAAGKAAMLFQGPWAYTGILGASPDLQVGMFPLPCTENTEDTKAWVNLDLVLFTPRSATGAKQDGGLAVLDYLMQPEILHQYNTDNLAFSPDIDAPAQDDPKVADMDAYVKSGRFYQGAGYFFPGAVSLQRYLQEYVYGGSLENFLGQLDRAWKRVAVRLSE